MRNSKKNKYKMRARRVASNRAAVSVRVAPTLEKRLLLQDRASARFTADANAVNSKRKAGSAFIGRVSIPFASGSTRSDAPTIDNPQGIVTSYITDGMSVTFQR
tara:strand:+ start:552 stop:863 length:312 start_codon:yes stop_codon:yes gene_type:complete